MSDLNKKIDKTTPAEDLTEGGVYASGSAKCFKTGDWRSQTPIWNSELCKQCGLCIPVCPEDCIIYDENGNRKDFDYDFCKGCGVCAKVCPFKAITMKEGGTK